MIDDIEIEIIGADEDAETIVEPTPVKRGRKPKAAKAEVEDKPVKAEKLFPIKLLRNFRPEGFDKMPAGSEIEVSVAEAKRAIELGIAVRNDPIA